MSAVRVLVVDDLEDWRGFVSFRLETEPFEIIGEAMDGFMAVRLAEQMQPTVVLLDIGLPGMDGIKAGGQIRRVAPGAKIVFVSQEVDPDIVRAALHLGASGYVQKFDAAQELVEAIHAVVRGEKFVSRSLAGHGFIDSHDGVDQIDHAGASSTDL